MEGIIGGVGSNNINLRALISQNGGPKQLGSEANKIEQRILTQTLADVLGQISLPQNEHYEKLAKALLEYNQPLKKENLEGLSRLLKQVGGEENTSLLAFLQSKNIPLNKDLVQTIKTFFQEKSLTNLISKALEGEDIPPQIAKLIEKMTPEQRQQLTRDLEAGMNSSEGVEAFQQNNRQQQNTNKLEQQIKNVIKNVKEDFSQSIHIITQTLQESTPEIRQKLIEKMPLLKELAPGQSSLDDLLVKLPKLQEQLTKLLQDPNLPPPEKAVVLRMLEKVNSWSEEKQKVLETIKQNFKEIAPEVREKILNKLGEVLPKEEQSSKIIKNLNNLLQDNEKLEGLPKVLKELIMDGQNLQGEKLTEALKKVVEHKKEFTQESAFSAKDIPTKEALSKIWPDLKGSLEAENLLKYYQIPIATKEGLYQALIKIDPKARGKRPGEEAGKGLVIFLDTKNLGQVRIDLTAQNKGLTFRFGVEEEEIKEDLESSFPNLVQRLSALNYRVREVSCVIQQEKPEETYLEMEKSLVLSNIKKIDLLT